MKTLIIDSGGTKADWTLIRSDEPITAMSAGIDIYSDAIEIPSDLMAYIKDTTSIHFYGAGVFGDIQRKLVHTALEKAFLTSKNITVHSDMIGAARATAGNERGIICILGTGSNSCVYDGKNIVKQIPSLGYIIGDDGAGTSIGKALLKAYFYGEMPSQVSDAFAQVYPITKERVLARLRKENSAHYLANFARFPKEYPSEYLNALVAAEITTFVERRILSYREYLDYPIHFIGSIAYFYQNILRSVCARYSLQVECIVQKPMEGLIVYHEKK